MRTAAHDHNPREFFCDELNFAEFPLAALGDTAPRGQKTLEFSDTVFDKSRNAEVVRRLCITAADKYGLPTAMDDDVVLGLIQLTARTDFRDRQVHFTRYELLRLLGWTDYSRDYARLTQSLKRWLGVTLFYDNSWWSREERSWVSEGFHVLDYVQILDRERRSRRAGELSGKSVFVWNDLVFRSFKAGCLKQIDFEFYKSLSGAIAKRVFRFLDKRFYQQRQLEFDLRTFACEHLGLSRKYHNGELKRLLRPAIEELEGRGFLKSCADEKRFASREPGVWRVAFTRAGRATSAATGGNSTLIATLVQRGVSQRSASRLVADVDETSIRERVALFDWLVAHKDRRIARSPAGFLYKSIAGKFALPDDYLAATAEKKTPKKVVPFPIQTAVVADNPERARADRAAIARYWNALPANERACIEEELVRTSAPCLRERYREGQRAGGPFFQHLRRALIDRYVRDKLPELASCEPDGAARGSSNLGGPKNLIDPPA